MQERTTNNFEENCKLASVACPLIRHGDVAVIGEGRRETRQKQEWTTIVKFFKVDIFILRTNGKFETGK